MLNSETRIRQGGCVSRVEYVSDTDTPGIWPGYVSTVCPRIHATVTLETHERIHIQRRRAGHARRSVRTRCSARPRPRAAPLLPWPRATRAAPPASAAPPAPLRPRPSAPSGEEEGRQRGRGSSQAPAVALHPPRTERELRRCFVPPRHVSCADSESRSREERK